MKKLVILSLVLLGALSIGHAQDKIFMKDKSVLICKVVEIGLDEIKYKELEMEDSPIIAIAIDRLIKVELSNGRVIEFKNPLTDPASYVDNKKSALKIHFLSPLMENLTFSYEKSLKPGRSFETSLGFIGVGFDTEPHIKSQGVHLGVGYKFMRTPDYYAKRFVYAHILKGAYIQPQLLMSIYKLEREEEIYTGSGSTIENYEEDIFSTALIINFGKQVVYDNTFLIDWSLGVGYGYSSQKDYYDNSDFYPQWRAQQYGYILGDENFPIALTAKLKVGFLLK